MRPIANEKCHNSTIFQMQLRYGWSISVLLLAASLLAPAKMGNMTYQYNVYDAATYAALSPITWCTLFAWIIYTSHIGYTSKLFAFFYAALGNNNNFFSEKPNFSRYHHGHAVMSPIFDNDSHRVRRVFNTIPDLLL